MPIVASELKWYRSLVWNDSGGNGGRMSAVEIPPGVKNNIWPDVPTAERTAGSTKYRKVFLKVANDDDLVGQAAKVWVETPSPGDDECTIFPSTHDAVQSGVTGSEQQYGCGQLDANVSAGAGALTVLTEAGAARPIFANGMLIRVSDRANVDASGNEEFVRLASSGAVSWAGNVATLTLASGVTLANGYLAAETRVASVVEVGDIEGTHSGKIVTSDAGTFDDATYPPLVDAIGGVSQVWTLTFTSPSAFTATGDTLGAIGSGTIGADFSPNNPSFSRPYFTVFADAWGGTWANGDTLVFRTDPAAAPIMYKRRIPAGAGALGANQVIVAIDVETP